MYNIFQIQYLIQLFKENDPWCTREQNYAITAISFLEHTDKDFTDITIDDIKQYYMDHVYYEYVWG